LSSDRFVDGRRLAPLPCLATASLRRWSPMHRRRAPKAFGIVPRSRECGACAIVDPWTLRAPWAVGVLWSSRLTPRQKGPTFAIVHGSHRGSTRSPPSVALSALTPIAIGWCRWSGDCSGVSCFPACEGRGWCEEHLPQGRLQQGQSLDHLVGWTEVLGSKGHSNC
jgi:hypothetical protein